MRALKPDCLPSSVSTAIAVQHRASYFTSTKFFLISPVCTNGAIIQIKSLDCCEYYKRAHVKSFPQCPVYTMCSVSVNSWQGLEAPMSSHCYRWTRCQGSRSTGREVTETASGPQEHALDAEVEVAWMCAPCVPEGLPLGCREYNMLGSGPQVHGHHSVFWAQICTLFESSPSDSNHQLGLRTPHVSQRGNQSQTKQAHWVP